MKVDPDRQRITVSGRAIPQLEQRWLAFHKPLGVVTTADDEAGPPHGVRFHPGPPRAHLRGPARREDDGAAAAHDRRRGGASADPPEVPDSPELHRAGARAARPPRSTAALKQQVVVDGRPVVPLRVRVRPGKEGRSILDVTLTEGRNRIVRRWCEAMGLKVERLARLSYGPVRLGDLPVGTVPAADAGGGGRDLQGDRQAA